MFPIVNCIVMKTSFSNCTQYYDKNKDNTEFVAQNIFNFTENFDFLKCKIYSLKRLF